MVLAFLKGELMTNKMLLRVLKTIMAIGICLILLGVYLHNFSESIEEMGVTGIIISACCVAIGMIMSLPTKMYLTFIWVKHEADEANSKNHQTSIAE